MIASSGSRKLETETKHLYDDVATLTVAIQKAIMKGQKSVAILGDISESDRVSHEDFAVTCANAGPGIVGWVEDF